ncbi:MAG: ATP-binding protein [Bacteroidia bacterium]
MRCCLHLSVMTAVWQFLFRSRFSKLIAAIVFLVAAYLLVLPHSENTSAQLEPFQKTLAAKEVRLESELDSLIRRAEGKKWDDVFRQRPAYYNTLFAEEGLVLLGYEGDTLHFWSDNSVAVENYMKEVCLDEKMARLKNGWFEVVRKSTNSGRNYIGLILIRNAYPYQNQYLVNDFETQFSLPAETDIELGSSGSSTGIKNLKGEYLFSLVFKSSATSVVVDWHAWLNFILNLIGFILLIYFLRDETDKLAASIGTFYAALLGVGLVVLLRFITISLHFPAIFYDYELFSPKHYGDADSFWLSNLGDFLLNAVLLFWMVWFLNQRTRPSKKLLETKHIYLVVFAAGLFLLLATLGMFINSMFKGLIQNSDISFHVNDIFSLSIYSYIGLLIIAILLAAFFLAADRMVQVVLLFKLQARELLLIWTATALALIAIMHLLDNVDLVTVLWPFAVFAILFYGRSREQEQTFSFSLIVVLVFLFSLYSVHMLLKQGMHKEHDSRIVFAEKLAAEQDPIAEHLFTELEKKLRYDTALIRQSQTAWLDMSGFEKRIQQEYFSGYWEKYDIRISFFDTMCSPLLRSSSSLSDNITHFDELIARDGTPTYSPDFFFLNNRSGRISYLVRIILQKPGAEKHLGQGTLFVELDSKLLSEAIGFPELLLDREIGINKKLVNYSYAKYKSGQLINHSGKYPYNFSPDEFARYQGVQVFAETTGWNHYLYRPDGLTLVVLSKVEAGWLGKTTTFSYLFAFFSLLLIAALFIRQLFTAGFTFSNLSFKYRIQLVLVFIVLVSLGLFGAGSIYYIRQQYQTKNAEIISEKAHSVMLEVESKLEDNRLTPAYRDYATYLLKKFSNVFFTDINLYDPQGNLYASSRPKVFDEGLVSKKMNPEAYYQIDIDHRSEFIHDEHIGDLAYLSAYLPIKNKEGQLQAYLNLPYFAKQSDLEKEISTFLVALINVYVLLFALSVLAAIFISNYLTKPLRLIQEKMRQVKLGKKNESIAWYTRDELGSLVGEYNRMIAELANSAELLAQSERESAWREMAKQVAHEIKNPLTPMRLSIQLFERAYRDKAPEMDTKVERMAKTMIEQIDTLSSIATAFSDFARMPKPVNEEMDLCELLTSSIDLFRETSGEIEFRFDSGTIDEAPIFADREQLVRVFNNLFKNALQAIPEEREGKIEVRLTHAEHKFIVAVTDNGTGISDEVIDKIFVPNFTTKNTGMGLGLAMVKNIVESSNGSIWFETKAGLGTTFYVSFAEYLD